MGKEHDLPSLMSGGVDQNIVELTRTPPTNIPVCSEGCNRTLHAPDGRQLEICLRALQVFEAM
ncbi:hypothetical protein E2C01_082635 [Portunus trituberculatus]|uniref:Uncharacterized protein n=1 Tax=Portunus trituberculatus TaxID=210409 RepID=A0A5B7IV32_PORTR|nr:hypothetical protein [Portunus trituberculatus]